MLYLLIGVLFSSILTTVFKIAGITGYNSDRIMLINYITASVLSVTSTLESGHFGLLKNLSGLELGSLFKTPSLQSTAFLAVAVGVSLGAVFLISLVSISESVSRNGSALTSFFKSSGFVGGILFSVLILGEAPTLIRWLGIALTVTSLAILIGDFRLLKVTAPKALIAVFLYATIIEVGNKLFAAYAFSEYKSSLLAAIYTTALSLCIPYVLSRRKKNEAPSKLRIGEILCGALLGASNMLSVFFKLKGLETVDASVALPMFACGVLIVTTLIGIFLFKEKTNKRHLLAVVISLISIALLNM